MSTKKKIFTNGNISVCLNDAYFAKHTLLDVLLLIALNHSICMEELFGVCLAYSEEQRYKSLNIWPEGNKTTAFIALVQASLIGLILSCI